ncbi:MAG: nicotinamide-nucleotide adenylyltransferase [Candidatus Thermoplasmatota archaeon]|nr:nicotinamide-nucleotide adenylyltransferase [Candidatus Thermoplasmatota archaeon]
MKALYIGRFQPFHNGHLKIIQNFTKKYDEIIIGIGSSQYDHTLKNPFTSEERRLMIKKSLDNIDVKNYRIIELPDIHNYPKWVSHVISIVPDFDVVISNSPLTKRLFSEKGYTLEETPLYDRKEYSGEKIRKRIINDESWKDALPKPAYEIIESIGGISRLKELAKK